MVVAGLLTTDTGFPGLTMTVSMPASAALLAWIVLVGALGWRGVAAAG